MILNLLKIASIIGTIVMGILATRYDYKKDGRVTKYGRIGIAGVMVFGSFSVLAQLVQHNDELEKERNAEKAAVVAEARLKDQNDRQATIVANTTVANERQATILENMKVANEQQSTILDNTNVANDRIRTSVEKQEQISHDLTTFSTTLKKDFEDQLGLSRLLIASQKDAQQLIDQSFTRVRSQVADLEGGVRRNIDRLASPLRYMFVSYEGICSSPMR